MQTFWEIMLLLTLKKQDFVQLLLKCDKYCLYPEPEPKPEPKLFWSQNKNQNRNRNKLQGYK